MYSCKYTVRLYMCCMLKMVHPNVYVGLHSPSLFRGGGGGLLNGWLTPPHLADAGPAGRQTGRQAGRQADRHSRQVRQIGSEDGE
jgi:hypothetical protein